VGSSEIFGGSRFRYRRNDISKSTRNSVYQSSPIRARFNPRDICRLIIPIIKCHEWSTLKRQCATIAPSSINGTRTTINPPRLALLSLGLPRKRGLRGEEQLDSDYQQVQGFQVLGRGQTAKLPYRKKPIDRRKAAASRTLSWGWIQACRGKIEWAERRPADSGQDTGNAEPCASAGDDES